LEPNTRDPLTGEDMEIEQEQSSDKSGHENDHIPIELSRVPIEELVHEDTIQEEPDHEEDSNSESNQVSSNRERYESMSGSVESVDSNQSLDVLELLKHLHPQRIRNYVFKD
jgi:hypothetical protein